MGIYYAAIDESAKELIESFDPHSIKFPGICHPSNPFSNMVIMKNAMGSNFEIVNDVSHDYNDKDYRNITKQTYDEFLNYYPDWRDHYEEDKN